MKFSQALEALEGGQRVKHALHGDGEWIYLAQEEHHNGQLVHAHLNRRKPDGTIAVGWLPSSEEILFAEWSIA